MKVRNRTEIRTAVLKPFLDFARHHAGSLAELTTVEFRKADEGCIVSGLALKDEFGGAITGFDFNGTCTEPSLVIIRLSDEDPRHYPHQQQVVPELEPVTINSWIEEVLLVIAHELRHIAQFWDPDFNEDPHMMEVDAEAFAIETLNAWRGATAQRRAA